MSVMKEIIAQIYIKDGFADIVHSYLLPIDINKFMFENFEQWNFEVNRSYEVRELNLGFINNVSSMNINDLNVLYYKFNELDINIQKYYEELCLQHFNTFDSLYESILIMKS